MGLGFADAATVAVTVAVTVCSLVTVWLNVTIDVTRAVTVLVAEEHVTGLPTVTVTVVGTPLTGALVPGWSTGSPPPHRPKTALHPVAQYSVVLPQ